MRSAFLVASLAFDWTEENVLVRRGSGFESYRHIHLLADFDVELSVYPSRERRHRPRSSTDGKPIDRMSAARVAQLIQSDA